MKHSRVLFYEKTLNYVLVKKKNKTSREYRTVNTHILYAFRSQTSVKYFYSVGNTEGRFQSCVSQR